MRATLIDRVRALGLWLRSTLGPPYDAAPHLGTPDMPPPAPADRRAELTEATQQMSDAAQHGKVISRMITETNDPSNPDSFERQMRNLLGRIP